MRPRSVFQPGMPEAKCLVRVGDALVILFAEFVFVRVRIGIAAAPEFFDEVFALVVGGQFLKGFSFFVGDDVGDVLVEPVFVSLLQFGLTLRGFSDGS